MWSARSRYPNGPAGLVIAAARPAAAGSTPSKGPASGVVVIGSVTADGVTLVRIRPPEPFTRKDR